MKRTFTAALLISVFAACSKTTVTKETAATKETIATFKIVKGSEIKKLMPDITDPKIYDSTGNVVDSATARRMVRSFDYTLGRGTPVGQAETKRMLFKVNHATEGRFDADMKMRLRPKSPKLWEGVTLDLTPLAKHADLSKLNGKAIVLLFWNNRYGNMYERVNDVTSDYINGNKFAVFAITDLGYAEAKTAQKTTPILNARHIVDAQDITSFYATGGDALVVVTNAQHKITYAVTGSAAMTPRILNSLLKTL